MLASPKRAFKVQKKVIRSAVLVALGRQSAIPRITGPPNPISSSLQIVTSDVAPNCLLEQTTPPPQQICSSKPEKQRRLAAILCYQRQRSITVYLVLLAKDFSTLNQPPHSTQKLNPAQKRKLWPSTKQISLVLFTLSFSLCQSSRQLKIYQLLLMSHRRVLPVKSVNNFGCALIDMSKNSHRSLIMLKKISFVKLCTCFTYVFFIAAAPANYELITDRVLCFPATRLSIDTPPFVA